MRGREDLLYARRRAEVHECKIAHSGKVSKDRTTPGERVSERKKRREEKREHRKQA